MIIDRLNGKRLAIVCLGPSSRGYLDFAGGAVDRIAAWDETWTCNNFITVIQHDRAFVMDDVRLLMKDPDPDMPLMLNAMKKHPGPIYTSRPHPDFPALVAYPLEAVANEFFTDYFNNVTAYMIALACAYRVSHLSLFGVDFRAMDSKDAPHGRECVEFWLGIAHILGITVEIPTTSPLLGMEGIVKNRGIRELYGYETLEFTKARYSKRVVDGQERFWLDMSSVERPESMWPEPKPLDAR